MSNVDVWKLWQMKPKLTASQWKWENINYDNLSKVMLPDRKRYKRRELKIETEIEMQHKELHIEYTNRNGKISQMCIIDAVEIQLHISCQQSTVDWSEIKRNSRGRRSRWYLVLIEFCTNSGQIQLGSSVHRNPDITPEYKTLEVWQAACSVSEMGRRSFNEGVFSSSFWQEVPTSWAAVHSDVIICIGRRRMNRNKEKSDMKEIPWAPQVFIWVLRLKCVCQCM